jgi:hypothetical protein
MFFSYGEIARFEESVYKAFPIYPVPEIKWDRKTFFADQARKLLTGRTWPEVVGYRLIDGELDPSLSIWMKYMPLNIFHYYLPSHLIFSTALLEAGPDSLMYPMDVMEALILPPSTDESILQKMDDDGFFESSLAENAGFRTALYEKMSKEQRVCIATYLSLYLDRRYIEPQVMPIYMKNHDIWEKSLVL